jgi:hypothetical protein
MMTLMFKQMLGVRAAYVLEARKSYSNLVVKIRGNRATGGLKRKNGKILLQLI